MNKNSVQYLQDINVSQLTLTENTEIKRTLKINNMGNLIKSFWLIT
jgi:hypothetical protein